MTDETQTIEPHVDDPVEVADKPREPTSYERQLRKEAAKHRETAKAAKEALEAHKATHEAEKSAIMAQAKADADLRVIRAELKAAAIKAGMVDLDGLKLLDLSSVKLLDNGDIEGADELMAKAKEAKPYLFAVAASTSSTAAPPAKNPPSAKNALDMAEAEYKAARARIK